MIHGVYGRRLRELWLTLELIERAGRDDWRNEMTLLLDVMDRLRVVVRGALDYPEPHTGAFHRRQLEDVESAVGLFSANLRQTMSSSIGPREAERSSAIERCRLAATILLGSAELALPMSSMARTPD